MNRFVFSLSNKGCLKGLKVILAIMYAGCCCSGCRSLKMFDNDSSLITSEQLVYICSS